MEKEFEESWYLKNVTIGILLAVCSLIPFAAIIVIPLVVIKSKKLVTALSQKNSYIEELESKVAIELEKAKEESLRMIRETEDKLSQLEHDKAIILADLDNKIENQQDFINQLTKQTKETALREVVIEIEQRNQELASINADIAKKDALISEITSLEYKESTLQKNIVSWENKLNRLKTVHKSINSCMTKYLKNEKDSPIYQLVHIPDDLLIESENICPAVTLKLHNMDYKDLRKLFKENDKLIKQVLAKYETRYVNKTTTAIYKLMVIALQAELQNILYTLTYSKLDESIAKVQEICKNYLNIAESGNKTISVTLAKFIGEIEYLCIEAVKIEYEYYVKKEAARQEQLALREQMRQEAEEKKLLEQQRQQIEKEESKYKTEIENIQNQIQESQDDAKTKQLLEKIKELESQLNDVEKQKDDIVNLQNGKAGYVYVISNLGSFGDDVFKVGMTRRLNPQDRVDELGDASVPFKFDVHSFIFAEDAVQLESNLHTALEKNRLNKVNLRKEFFKISIDELENLVDKFDPTAEFNKTMIAEQYRQSQSIDYEDTQIA